MLTSGLWLHFGVFSSLQGTRFNLLEMCWASTCPISLWRRMLFLAWWLGSQEGRLSLLLQECATPQTALVHCELLYFLSRDSHLLSESHTSAAGFHHRSLCQYAVIHYVRTSHSVFKSVKHHVWAFWPKLLASQTLTKINYKNLFTILPHHLNLDKKKNLRDLR